MDYAINPHQPDLANQIKQWLTKDTGVKNAAKWLLIDAGLLEQNAFLKLTEAYKETSLHNVFLKTRFEVYGVYAPHLFCIDQLECDTQAEFISKLLNLSSGIPALALLDACDDATSLAHCITWFAQTHTQDDLELYCRLADTRIAPGLVQVLNEEQKLKLTQNILQWQIVNRLGTLEPLLPNIKPQLEDEKSPFNKFASAKAFTLSDEQFKVMMDKSEADEIFKRLLENHSDLVPDKDRGSFYQRVAQSSQSAHQHALEKTSDLVIFTVLALTSHDKFEEHPVLKETWVSLKQKGVNFSSLVKEWPDSVWGELAQPAIQ